MRTRHLLGGIAMLICVLGLVTSAYAAPVHLAQFTDRGLYEPGQDSVNPYDKVYDSIPERPAEMLTEETKLEDLILHIANWIMIFLGLTMFIFLIYAGFLWTTARNDEEMVTKAKKILLHVAIGTIVVLSAFTIVFTLVGGRGRLFFY